MTKLLEQAIETARRLPTDEQDAIARAILQLAGRDDLPPVPLTPEEREAIAKSKAAAARGEFASDDEVRAIWGRSIVEWAERPVRRSFCEGGSEAPRSCV